MITGIRVKNLRAIADSGVIELKKINVIVGRNSAGKSTMLRIFPLLKQSVEQKTKGPLLWYGRLVDFGSFQNAVKSGGADRTITLEFKMVLDSSRKSVPLSSDALGVRPRRRARRIDLDVSVLMGTGEEDEVGRIKELHLGFKDDKIVVSFGNNAIVNSVAVNGIAINLRGNQQWLIRPGNVVPSLYVLRETEITDTSGEKRKYLAYDGDPFSSQIIKALMVLVHGNTQSSRMRGVVGQLAYAPAGEFHKQLQEFPGLPPSFYQNLEAYGPESWAVKQIRMYVLLSSLTALMSEIDSELMGFATNIKYIEPLRATAERYYRLQDLAVDEIDSRGTNVAMFLSSLSDAEMDSLQNWMNEKLGFHVRVLRSTGHVEVQIVPSEGIAQNLADLGFGFSQILPIILQIWRAMVYLGRSRDIRPLIAVEQPELHLHPEYQALVADVVSSVFAGKNLSSGGFFFAETHSEHFINRMGELISEKRLSPEDIQIIVVEQEGCEDAKVSIAEYTSAGYLGPGWPSGFFVPGRK